MTATIGGTLPTVLPSAERVAAARARLEEAGVRYVLSCWIDLLGQPKTKPVPLERFEELCAGRGPQFAVHSVSMVPELGAADPDQVMVPDLDSLVVCPWDRTLAWVFADLSELMALATQGRITLQTQRYALADAPQALDDLDRGRVRGRAVLVP